MALRPVQVFLASPRGFCAGVIRAIQTAEYALENLSGPIYIKHEIVHNKRIVQNLKNMGAIFVEHVSEIPDGSIAIFSAHGSPIQDYEQATKKNIQVIDATCPLVSKVHKRLSKQEAEGKEIIIIGHKEHVETIGTAGNAKQIPHIIESSEQVDRLGVKDPNKLSFVTQTTLSVDDVADILDKLYKKFPNIESGPDKHGNTCYATQNRQNAVKQMISEGIDTLIVLGSQNSSNSKRLKEIGIKHNVPSYLVDSADEISLDNLANSCKIGVTAGASAHEEFVQELLFLLSQHFIVTTKTILAATENTYFHPPKIVRGPLSKK